MKTNTSANLTDNAWVRRINELRTDLEDCYSAMDVGTYAEACAWLLSDQCETEYDLDDTVFLRKDALRQDETAAASAEPMTAPTVKQMEAAFFAQRTNEDAATEGCTPEQIMRDFDYTAEHKAIYDVGVAMLREWKYTVGKRSTLPPAPADNQIVVDSGYIAASPAYRLVTFSRK